MRRLFTSLSGLSLLLCLALAAVWVRSHWVTDDWWVIYADGGSEHVRYSRGQVLLKRHLADRRKAVGEFERLTHRATPSHTLPPSDLAPPKPSFDPFGLVGANAWPIVKRWTVFNYAERPLHPDVLAREARAAQKAMDEYLADVAAGRVNPDAAPNGIDVRLYMLQRRVSNAPQAPKTPDYSLEWQLTFPAWLPVVLAGVLPAFALVGLFRRHRRGRAGLCRNCGYDLRASTDRCPECGEPLKSRVAVGSTISPDLQ